MLAGSLRRVRMDMAALTYKNYRVSDSDDLRETSGDEDRKQKEKFLQGPPAFQGRETGLIFEGTTEQEPQFHRVVGDG
jgi:hypothetical protein